MQFFKYVYADNMAGRAAKQLLRRELKARLLALSNSEKIRQSKIVTEQLLSTEQYRNSRRVSLYLSMMSEVHTDDILQNIFDSGRECFVPRYIGSSMDMVRLHSMDDFLSLPETAWKIKQPADDAEREDALETGGLDLIIIPGLGFTRRGDRIGRGKGYYDTYLHTYQQKMKVKPATVALAFYEQICDTIPTTDQDVPIDLVLFEDKTSQHENITH